MSDPSEHEPSRELREALARALHKAVYVAHYATGPYEDDPSPVALTGLGYMAAADAVAPFITAAEREAEGERQIAGQLRAELEEAERNKDFNYQRGAAERQEQIVAALRAEAHEQFESAPWQEAADFIESLPVLPPSDLREAEGRAEAGTPHLLIGGRGEPCGTCKGTGHKFVDDFAAMGYETPPCPDCNGTGRADPRAQEGESDG